ncbi:MAG: 30S ribosomal protein S17 [Myxococcota bacterium]
MADTDSDGRRPVETPQGTAYLEIGADGSVHIQGPPEAVRYINDHLQRAIAQARGDRRPRRRVLTGRVIKNKMTKTVVVQVTRRVRHRRYGKYVERRKTYMAHDEHEECKVDDVVVIQECRPLSRHKRHRVVSIYSQERGMAGRP